MFHIITSATTSFDVSVSRVVDRSRDVCVKRKMGWNRPERPSAGPTSGERRSGRNHDLYKQIILLGSKLLSDPLIKAKNEKNMYFAASKCMSVLRYGGSTPGKCVLVF